MAFSHSVAARQHRQPAFAFNLTAVGDDEVAEAKSMKN